MVEGIVNTDNFFKFAFLSGLFLVIFALIYPLKQEHELQMKICEFNAEQDKIMSVITAAKEDRSKIELIVNRMEEIRRDSSVATIEYEDLNSKRIIAEARYDSSYKDLEFAVIEHEYNGKLGKLLEDQVRDFKVWKWILVIVGGLLALPGGIIWCLWTFKRFKNE